MPSFRAKRLARILIVAGLAMAGTAHAVHTRLEERRGEQELAAMTAAIEPLTAVSGGTRRVTLNGATMFFTRSTEPRPLEDVTTTVARDCASGDEEIALGVSSETFRDSSIRAEIKLERVVTQESSSGSVRASLCIFAPDDRRGEPTPRVRYTLARRVDDTTTSVTSIVSASTTPLTGLFPADGDAPGSDLPGAARPERSRRSLTAIVGNNEYSVRIYDSPLSTEAAAVSYDTAMDHLGWTTTAALADARMFRRTDGATIVASFRTTTDGCAITIAPFAPSPKTLRRDRR